ncbi:unnamed protein product [Dicrocoelium dendriticum]|nr:unnamed protein product [Dicrocoelium dendriticum]
MEDVDDSFYSRQRCVLGEDAMRKMAKSKVFLYGLGGVGIEIAKNLILGGVEELIIQDDRVCESRDLYSQFFIRPEDVIRGISRAEASLPHLVALNPYVRVSVERRNLTTIRSPLEHKANEELLQALVANNEERSRNVECLIVTQCPLHAAVLLNLFCRKHNIRFIYSDVYGAFGFLFCDFGVNFLIKDPTGETPKEFFIGHIEILNSTQILVKVFADRRHQLETGQVVEFRELSGMSELNGKAFAVQVVSSSELLIEMDTGNLSPYIGGGVAVQIVQPQIQHFDSLLEQLHEPRIATADLSHPNEGILLHHIFLSLMAFRHDEQRFPEPWREPDWTLFNQKFQTLQGLVPYKLDQVDQEFVRRLALVSPGELSPLCAVFGGVVAQEAMKALTGCFTPYNQWFYMHCESVVPRTFPPSHSTLNTSRYEPLAICIGFEPLQRLQNLNVFMVGCGAIGCELLKNLALLGVATAQSDSRCPRFADYAGSKPGLNTVDSCKLDSLPSDDCRETGVIDQRSLCDSSNELARSARFCSTESMSPQLLPLHAVAGDTTTEEGVPLGPTLPVTQSMKEPTNEIAPGYGPGLGADPNSAHLYSPSSPHTSITTPMDQAPPFVGKDGDTVRAHTNQFTEPTTFTHNTAHLLNLTTNRHPTSMMSGEGCLSTTSSHLRNASKMASTPSATGDTSELDDLATTTTTTASSPYEHQRPGQVQPKSAEMKPDHAVFQPCITITDPDHIEKSNLNRQFLFHSEHIGRPKAQIAALAARTINPAINIRPMEEKVCSSTEKTLFTDAFLLTATGSSPSTASHRTTGVVLAALDCVASRRYLDTRCVSLHLPLFESGTLGTKGHVQIVLPGLTESYNSQHDDDSGSVTEGPDADGAQSIPYCTLKSFPTLPVHCIEWAREKFTSQFTLKPEKLSQLLSALDRTSPGARLLELASVLLKTTTSKMSEAELKTKTTWLCSQLTYSIARFLSSRPVDWVGCVQLARTKFERYFNHKAKQLLHAFPPDTKLADGSPFWQLPKRQPTPLSFRSSDPL